MLHANSDSDVTSLAPSSPISPKRSVYYVQSPSRDSNDEDKSSTMQATPNFTSPMESPTHTSYGRHSQDSSASRVSGVYGSGSGNGRKGNRKRTDKGWPECGVIEEENDYFYYYYRDKGLSRRCQVLLASVGLLVVFSVFCLIIWGASRPYKTRVIVKNLTVHDFYVGEGSDRTGVPTKLLTMNCSVTMTVFNPATFFGIHVSSTPVYLMYSKLIVATGQWKNYYQERRSRRTVSINLEGSKVPLYGAGASLAASKNNGGVPMTLLFEVRSRGDVVGKLVISKHRCTVSCSVVVDSDNVEPIKLGHHQCGETPLI